MFFDLPDLQPSTCVWRRSAAAVKLADLRQAGVSKLKCARHLIPSIYWGSTI